MKTLILSLFFLSSPVHAEVLLTETIPNSHGTTLRVYTDKSPSFNPTVPHSQGHIMECLAKSKDMWGKFLKYQVTGSSISHQGSIMRHNTKSCSQRASTVRAALEKTTLSPKVFQCTGNQEFLINTGSDKRDALVHNFGMDSTYMTIMDPSQDRVSSFRMVYQKDQVEGTDHLYYILDRMAGAGSYEGAFDSRRDTGYSPVESWLSHLRGVRYSECLQGETSYGIVFGDAILSDRNTVFEEGFITGSVEAWKQSKKEKYDARDLRGFVIYKGRDYYMTIARKRAQQIEPIIKAMRDTNFCGACPQEAAQILAPANTEDAEAQAHHDEAGVQ